MDIEELRRRQAPLKELYRKEPARAEWVLSAEGTIDPEGLRVILRTGHGDVTAGHHPATGGSGKEACSGEMLLDAMAACAGVTLSSVAVALGITLRRANVRVEAPLDFRGTLGVDRSVPVGFREVRLLFNVDSDADEAGLANLLRLTERYCVVFQTLRQTPTVSAAISRISEVP